MRPAFTRDAKHPRYSVSGKTPRERGPFESPGRGAHLHLPTGVEERCKGIFVLKRAKVCTRHIGWIENNY